MDEPVVGEQRFGDVALCRERLHEERVTRLAVGRPLDEPARRPLESVGGTDI